MEKKELKIIEETTKEVLKLLGIDGTIKVTKNEDGADIVLETEERGIIIGYHGDILESLQLVLSLCVSKKIGRFFRISLEVGEYKKNREDWLKFLALGTRDKVVEQKREISLPQLKAWERRIIHLMFQDDEEVITESTGEGKDRVLVVKPKN